MLLDFKAFLLFSQNVYYIVSVLLFVVLLLSRPLYSLCEIHSEFTTTALTFVKSNNNNYGRIYRGVKQNCDFLHRGKNC